MLEIRPTSSPAKKPNRVLGKSCFWVAWCSAALISLGYFAIYFVAVFAPGGHPPLSAYVGYGVLVGSLGVAPLGIVSAVLAGRWGGLRSIKRQRLATAATIMNVLLLAFAIFYLFLRG